MTSRNWRKLEGNEIFKLKNSREKVTRVTVEGRKRQGGSFKLEVWSMRIRRALGRKKQQQKN